MLISEKKARKKRRRLRKREEKRMSQDQRFTFEY